MHGHRAIYVRRDVSHCDGDCRRAAGRSHRDTTAEYVGGGAIFMSVCLSVSPRDNYTRRHAHYRSTGRTTE